MSDEEREFSFKSFWGPEYLKSRVEFSRKGEHYCIYCGEKSDTREHCPSKTFLSKPYPNDLPVLPACFKCNNGFSKDEMYTEVYIDALKFLSGYSDAMSDKNKEHIYNNTAFNDAQTDLSIYYETGTMNKREKIYRILTKLSICHMVYDLTEGYSLDGCSIIPIKIEYQFAFEMSKNQKEKFDELIFMSNKKFPIIGSRVFDRIYVLEPILKQYSNNTEGKGDIRIPLAIMNWYDVQNENYRYVTWLEEDDNFHVKIVIHNFLYAEVIFPQNNLC